MTPIVVRIREIREAKGWTQELLAERAGTRQATISDLETGRTGRVDLDLLERIATALEVEPGALLVREPKRRR
jgi:transcriptional regulator with XRE-family HTH domain